MSGSAEEGLVGGRGAPRALAWRGISWRSAGWERRERKSLGARRWWGADGADVGAAHLGEGRAGWAPRALDRRCASGIRHLPCSPAGVRHGWIRRAPVGARRDRGPVRVHRARRARPVAAEARTELARISASSPFLNLPVERHHPAVVSLPLGATGQRVIVVSHGAGGQPEDQCHRWRGILEDGAHPLPARLSVEPLRAAESDRLFLHDAPRARPRDHPRARRAEGALPRSRRHDAPRPTRASRRARSWAPAPPNHPARFARAALIEGGYGFFQEWNVPAARPASGAAAVACSSAWAAALRRAGAHLGVYFAAQASEARVLHAEGAGTPTRGR